MKTYFKFKRKQTLLSIISLFIVYVSSAQILIHYPATALLNNLLPELSNTTSNDLLASIKASDKPALSKNTSNKSLSNTQLQKYKSSIKAGVVSASSKAFASGNGSILLVTSSANNFSKYTAEILLAEGFNGFASTDIGALTTDILNTYEVVIVGDISLNESQVSMLGNWTAAGGTLITLSPDIKLASILGLSPAGGTLTNKYLQVKTASGPGKGIVNQSIQFKGNADLYTLNGATEIATLYASAGSPTSNPAVTINRVGELGGTAAAFTYDLARSVVYLRQGNPDWAGQERDNQSGPIRSNDLFFPDWVDLNKVAIPQADEQQRLLANIILQSAHKPLPRFWYLPRGLKAAVVMTGDDHGNGGTKGRFDNYYNSSTNNDPDAVADWRAIRATSYIYPGTPISDAEVEDLENKGFEIALHLNTGCSNFTTSSLANNLESQLADFKNNYPSASNPVTNRTHCIAWSDWDSNPKQESLKGIRLDANYYYWPGSWLQDRPGMFTGSGMPMRFAALDGGTIDCYQLTTQMTDESDMTYAKHIDQLLDNALGAPGYYGTFCANMHTDAVSSTGSDAIIASAKARNVPVISSKQLLTWLDGRNGSSFSNMTWSGNELSFEASIAGGARNIEGMLPLTENVGSIKSLSVNGSPVSFRLETIKGIEYAFFKCTSGSYLAVYDKEALPNQAPAVAITSPVNNAVIQAPATIILTASASDPDGSVSQVEFFQGTQSIGKATKGADAWSYTWSNVAAGSYSITAKATDNNGAVSTSEAISITVSATCPCTVFKSTDVPNLIGLNDNRGGIQLGMRFRSTVDGFITGVRFYKDSKNTGTHTGELYSNTGVRLAQIIFQNETESGWQEAKFATPVAIKAGTTYLISYHSSLGNYAATVPYFSQAKDSSPLRALAHAEDGPNGVFLYTNSPAFPTNNYNAGNYYVDAVFETSAPANDNVAPSVAITSPAANASYTAPASINIAANASDTDGSIAKVEFYNGAALLGTDEAEPYEYNWNNVAAGSYQLTAKATDNEGKSTTSAAVPVNVTGVTIPSGPGSITAENELPGNPESEWQVSGAGDMSIQGFATDMSYNKGETARFKIKTNASAYTINIYRLGYYKGNGARLQGSATVTASLPQAQPTCATNAETGLVDCGNWGESANWVIPANAVSGIYIAKLTRTDTRGSSHIVFIVRDDASTSDLLFQTSDATWQAYNVYGDNGNGKSLYTGAGGKAVKVSYNRPFVTRGGGGGGGPEEDWLFNAEYPMVRWLEANGYDVTYTTNVDSDRRGNLIANHRVFLSVGHDEYWSGPHRTHVTNARNSGTNLAFFSGNEVYWKTRWENSIDGSGASHRTLVCYKEGSSGENTCNGKCDPSSEWTGQWRSGCDYTAGDPLACNPENELTGQISWAENTAAIQVPNTYKSLRFWRNTSIASLGDGQSATLTNGTIGYEWNPEQEQFRATYPKGRIILSRTMIGDKVHHLSLYRHSSGAWVFGAGTVQWSWGLDSNHDRGSAPASKDMQQATVNLFADMGVQPASLQSGLVPASASSDTQAPVTVISNPTENATIPANKEVVISGTASDAATVAGVEVSTDGGKTWKVANGTTSWTFAWIPTTQGAAVVQSRAYDDSGNMGAPVTLNLTIGEPGAIACPCNVFQSSEGPAAGSILNKDNDIGIQLGMRFKSAIDGFVTGVRFYKQTGNTGTHTGQLFSNTGESLAKVTFINETASGWQEAKFDAPIAIKAGTTYVISYHSSAGYYSATGSFFGQTLDRNPLQGLATTVSEPNGIFLYTSTPAFPTQTYQGGNYWVDVVFNTVASEPANQAPTISLTSPANNSEHQAPATITINATASDPDGSVSQVEFFNGPTSLGVDAIGTDGWSYTWNNVTAGSYPITAKATDNKGTVTTSEVATITVTAICPCTVFNPAEPPVNSIFKGTAIQLGMRFRSTVNGFVNGVRFYKHIENTGTHIGQLYSNTGTLLANVTFENETASGWQEATFSSPVAITAGTTYIISYHSSNGTYSATNDAFKTAINRSPLIVLADGVDGGNGVFIESTVPAFPTASFKSSNYWVDVVFNTAASEPANVPPVVSITAPVANATFTAPAAITISADASDQGGTVTKVEFFNGETKLGEDLTSPYEFNWQNVAAGTYQLTAKATDDKNAVTTSSTVSITVNSPENKLPVVSITSPINNASFTAPANISIIASATDDDGTISKVEFFEGNNKLGEDLTSSDGWTYSWANVTAGTYALTIKATDNSEGSSTSVATNITVGNPVNQVPVVSKTIPDQNATIGILYTYTIEAGTFSDNDGDGLTYRASLADDGALPAWLSFADATFSGTPPAESTAALDIKVTATDGKGGEASDEFKLTVNQPNNHAPVLASIGAKLVAEGSQLSFQASATDEDVPANTLTFTLVNGPTGAGITATGAFTWTPAENQNGEHNVTIKVSDGSLSDEETIKVTVSEVNTAPVLAAIGNKSIAEGGTLTFTAAATDADIPANNLAYSLINAPDGASINSESGVFSWSPGENQSGSYTFKVKVTDNGSPALSGEEELTVTVTEENAAPILSLATIPTSVNELVPFSLQASATDADLPANSLTFSLTKAPAGATINGTSGLINWTPTEAQGNGAAHEFTVQVSDGDKTDAESFSLTVNEVNVAPVLSSIGAKSVTRPNTLSFQAAATDSDLPVNTLSFTLVDAPTGASINAATGAFSWTPAEEQVGSHTVTVKVADGNLSDEEQITVTVLAPENKAPAISIISPEDGGGFTAPATVLIEATATDQDGTIQKVEFYNGTAKIGEDTDGSNGWKYSWTNVAANTYNLSAKATDNAAAVTTSAIVSITVTMPVNKLPVVSNPIPDQNATIGKAFTYIVAANAFTDPDGDVLSYTSALANNAALPTWLNFNTITRTFAGTPPADAGASLDIKVTANDGRGGTVSDNFILTISQPVNHAPVLATIGPKSVSELSLLTFQATATDTDIPANTLSYTLLNAPTGASINAQTGIFSWTPAENQNGTHTFTVKVTDNGSPALSDSESITVTVTEKNTAPVLTLPVRPASVNELVAFSLKATATDTDLPANTLSFSLTASPAGAAINTTTGQITWTPTEAQGNGTSYTFTVQVSDGSMVDKETFAITVNEVNVAPILAAISQKSVTRPQTLTFQASASDTDLPVNMLAYTLVGAPAGAVINSVTGAFSWTPAAGQVGDHTFRVKVSDGALSDDQEVKVSVTQTNVAPVLVAIGNKAISEATLLTFKATATDADVPADKLTYTLTGTVPEAKIDAVTGVFTWTPSEAHGPGSYTFTIKVSDGVLTDAETIQVQVSEVNQAPQLANIGNKSVTVGTTLRFALIGTDADIPVQRLSYSANKLPEGATLNAATGVFSWKPGSEQVGNHKVNFKVTDGIVQTTQNASIVVNPAATTNVPVITSINPTRGSIGQKVTITGQNFTGVNAVYFKNTLASYIVMNASTIVTIVPAGATTGRITVKAASGGTAVSSDNFIVVGSKAGPVITKFSPARGAAGTKVLISGSHLSSVTKVSFGTTNAAFSIDKKGDILATVPKVIGRLPANLKITVASPSGNAISKDWFTVVGLSYASSSFHTLQTGELPEQNSLTVFPNPSHDHATINFTLEQQSGYSVTLYDNMGALVTELGKGIAEAGELQSIKLDGTKLSNGLYFIRLEWNRGKSTVKLLLEK